MSSIPSGHPDPPRKALVPLSVMMKDTASSSLEDLCLHINMKISDIKRCLLVRDIGKDESRKPVLRKLQNQVIRVHDLLNEMENEVKQQEKLKDSLKEMQKIAERDLKEAQHLLEHIPRYLPKPQSCNIVPTVKHKGQTKAVEPDTEKKPAREKKPAKENKPAKEKKAIKEAALITTEEFESIPAYLKGRIKHIQINAVVQGINKAVLGKYKILDKPLKSMSAPDRNLYHRFIEEETKDTKGACFIVEEDIKMFTQLKLDKRFYSILSILRHCQRVREIRGSGLIRYIIC